MRIPFALLFTILFSVETFAAPVSVGDDSALEVRARVKTVKATAKARPAVKRPPVVKAKPKVVAAKKVATIKKTVAAKKAPASKTVASKKKVTVPPGKTTPTKAKPSAKAAAKASAKPVTSALSCPVRPKTKKVTPKVGARTEELEARSLVPRRLAAAAAEGTSNICKKQVAGIPDFEALVLRGSNLCGSATLFYDYTEGESTVELKPNGFVLGQGGKFRNPAGSVCEHILELNILKDVMESPGGPCEQIAAKFTCTDTPTPKEIKALVAPIVKIINDKKLNIVLAQKDRIEAQKALIVEKAAGGAGSTDLAGVNAANQAPLLKGTNDYLTRTKDGSEGPNTLKVAADLDAEIQRIFPGTREKVVTEWNKVLTLATSLA